jgi:hypothetical protein
MTETDPSDHPRYSYKPSLLGSPIELELTPEALLWNAGRMKGQVPYNRIRRVRLSFRPVTMQHYRFVTEVWSDTSPKLTIASTSWKGIVDQERLDPAYSDFILALHRRIAQSGSRPRLDHGASPIVYWPGVVVFVMLGAGMIALIVKALAEPSLPAAALVAGFFALFLWQLGGFFLRNRPGQYQADAVPPITLPRRAG